MEVEPNWRKIFVVSKCGTFVYELNESEKLIFKFQKRKKRKDVTTKYKHYLYKHPNIEKVNMKDLESETLEMPSPIVNSAMNSNNQDNFKNNLENEVIFNSNELKSFELEHWSDENYQFDEESDKIIDDNFYL
ncbi:hypothetical protein M9Y10_015372 [Tritrichomonas musculus]|uniref:Uncharacterized protein n=1 Tax=Tritrichomonas musculus TaxID=1915356 RepID=A0ABR2L326_9EUKA